MNARQRWVVAGLAVLVAALGAVVVLQATGDDAGEDIFLEGKRDVGQDPFTTIALSRCPDGYVDAPADSQDECVPVASTTSVVGSTTTALFGGSGDQRVCDPEALITYLREHPDKGQAWVDALNEDPTLEWSGGTQLTLADIPAYIRELRPTFLTEDTRVTNHGFRDGKATPKQSVLQKGTAVLVDRNDVPRTRCACGNPLLPPKEVDDPHFEGECWEGCHDRPYCAPPGCSDTTTTSSSSTTSTTTCETIGAVAGQSGCEPPSTTSTTRQRTQRTQPTTASTAAPTTTAPPVTATTRATIPTTTTSPNQVTTTTGKT